MWKFHDFSITQILREINFGDFRHAKSAISTRLEALNFDFHEFLHFLNSDFYQMDKIHKRAKRAVLALLKSPKLISHKM